MQLFIGGARGSTPAIGEEFRRYGGNTPSLAVLGKGSADPLIIDAGTGIRRINAKFARPFFSGTILLSHLHWDHVQGLPFCGAIDNDQARVALLVPEQGQTVEVLKRMMSPPFFPIEPDELRGRWTFSGIEPGDFEAEGLQIRARDVPHKGGRTFGYRVSDGTSTFTYVSDHNPTELGEGEAGLGEYHDDVLELCEGSDLLFHDSQYTAADFPERSSWGHSAVEYAVGLAEKAGVSKLMLFHHDPNRTDDAIDDIVSRLSHASVPLEATVEGSTYEI